MLIPHVLVLFAQMELLSTSVEAYGYPIDSGIHVVVFVRLCMSNGLNHSAS